MNGRGMRVAASILIIALVLCAVSACGRKAKPEPLRSASCSDITRRSR